MNQVAFWGIFVSFCLLSKGKLIGPLKESITADLMCTNYKIRLIDRGHIFCAACFHWARHRSLAHILAVECKQDTA